MKVREPDQDSGVPLGLFIAVLVSGSLLIAVVVGGLGV